MPTRRHILTCLAGLAVTGPPACSLERGLQRRLAAASDVVQRYFARDKGARRVGNVVLDRLDVRTDAAVEPLVERPLALVETSDPSDIVRTLEARVRQDFAELDVLDVEGWTLSRTEVGLAVMFALT